MCQIDFNDGCLRSKGTWLANLTQETAQSPNCKVTFQHAVPWVVGPTLPHMNPEHLSPGVLGWNLKEGTEKLGASLVGCHW